LQRGLFGVVSSVPGSEISPFFGKIFDGEDGRNGANGNASATVYAFHRFDVEDFYFVKAGFVLFGMDTIYRASVNTRAIFGPNAGFSNYVSHWTLFTTGIPILTIGDGEYRPATMRSSAEITTYIRAVHCDR
jgi:hypothetical protein